VACYNACAAGAGHGRSESQANAQGKNQDQPKVLENVQNQLENFLTEKASKLGQTQQGTLQETQRTKGAPENGTYINRKLIDLDRS
jgi:hypothetical protein